MDWESREVQLPRVAFRLRIKAGKEAEYDAAHRNVWPALLSKLKEVGVSKYSIFRREQDLFLVMQVDDFDAAGCRTCHIRCSTRAGLNRAIRCPDVSVLDDDHPIRAGRLGRSDDASKRRCWVKLLQLVGPGIDDID